MGHTHYLKKDEEEKIMAITEIKGAHVLPRDTNTIHNELQQVIHGVGLQDATKTIKTNYALRYARRWIVCVNKEEENAYGQKRKTRIGTIKVSELFQKRAKKSDPKLAWEMFHNIYHVYSDINNKEKTNATLIRLDRASMSNACQDLCMVLPLRILDFRPVLGLSRAGLQTAIKHFNEF